MPEATIAIPYGATGAVNSPGQRALWLALKVALVLVICHFATQIGFAFKIPPHNISPLWPTGAILFSVLVVSPARHWWAYIFAAYFTSVINDARAGFPVSAMWFVAAGLGEILVAAVLVRRFAGGRQAFESTRGLAIYIAVAVVLAPAISAFVGALAGGAQSYWFYWRAWYLSEALAFLMLAPAILCWIGAFYSGRKIVSLARCIEACLIVVGLIAVCVRVFNWPTAGAASVPALVYLPLPLLLWAAVRFGPIGINTCLLIVAFLSIAGTVNGQGPFATGTPAENVPALQLFLATVSIPLMLLAAQIKEGHDRASAFRESELQLQEQRAELTHLSRVAVLGELTGALAHELNQPRTAILSNAQAAQRFLEQGPAHLGEVHEILKDIVDDDKRAGEVIRRLRALLKKGETQLQPLDLNDVVDEVFELARAECESRGVVLQRDLATFLPAVRGDRIQLQQVLLNLIVNACDAMSACEPRHRKLTVATALDKDGMVRASVSDCGHGIPADQLDLLFDPFYTTKAQGLGLGLTICRSIVAAHGGKLWAINNTSGGAKFCVSLPVNEGNQP
jgi:signal transduction histidine kinase